MNINIFEATQIVNKKLESIGSNLGIRVNLIEGKTIEKEFYFIFFYNTELYLDSGNLSYSLVENSPIIVDKIIGKIHNTRTAHPIEFYIDEFEEKKFPYLSK